MPPNRVMPPVMKDHPSIRLLFVLLLLAGIGLFTIDDAGVSTDEGEQVVMVQWNIDLIRRGTPIPPDVQYYGTAFNVSAEVAYRLARSLGFLDTEAIGSPAYRERQEFRQRVRVKHVLTFVLGLVAAVAAAGIAGVIVGPSLSRHVWIVPAVLATFPRFWGHSYFNPKDVPFAAMMTVGTYGGILLLRRLSSTASGNEKQLYLPALFFGALAALVTGFRIGGFLLLLFVPMAYLLVHRTRVRVDLVRFLPHYSVLVVVWAVMTVALHPASWANPFRWFTGALAFFSALEWGNTVLYAGEFISAESLPISYIPHWFSITTPLVWQGLFLNGMIWIPLRWTRLAAVQKMAVVLCLLQVFALPLVAIVRGSTLYDEIRQFLFIVPAVAVVCSVSVLWIFEQMSSTRFKWLCGVGLCVLVAPVIHDMVRLHPYEYCYFNRAFGGLKAAQGRYETDYWGLSMRAATEWINENNHDASLVVSSTHLRSSWTFARDGLTVILQEEYEEGEFAKDFYYIARPRWGLQHEFAHCPVVFEVRRRDASLTIVKRCS